MTGSACWTRRSSVSPVIHRLFSPFNSPPVPRVLPLLSHLPLPSSVLLLACTLPRVSCLLIHRQVYPTPLPPSSRPIPTSRIVPSLSPSGPPARRVLVSEANDVMACPLSPSQISSKRSRVAQRPVAKHALHRCGVRHRHALPHPCTVSRRELLQAVEGEKERPKERVGDWGGFDKHGSGHEHTVGGRGPQLHRSPTRWHEEGAWGDCTERLVDRRKHRTHSRRRAVLLQTGRDGILHRLVLDVIVGINAGR